MLSVDICKKILEQHGGDYSTEEVKLIREFLYNFAMLGFQEYQRKKQSDESNNIHTGINGLTSREGI